MSFANIVLILLAAKVGISSIKKYITRPHKLKMKLIEYSNTDNVKVIELPDELYEDNTIDVQNNQVYQKVYDDFGKVIESIVPREELDNYYHNFKTIKEVKTDSAYMLSTLLQGKVVGGTYNIKENLIDLETMAISKSMKSTYHELLHASSTRVDSHNHVIYSGLSQMFINSEEPRKNEVFGIGINEGVTQYLTNKYFNKKNISIASYGVYEEEQSIARLLEKIIGEDKLRSFYFKADLNGLVNELEKYITKEDIYKLINYTDVLFYYSRDKNLKFEKLNEVKTFINITLLKAYNNSIKAKGLEYTMKGSYDYPLPYKVK